MSSLLYCTQVNETLLRSIVTQPAEDNYVYARGFDTLERVRNLVLNKACRVILTAASTRPPITTTLPSTTSFTVDNRVDLPTVTPFFNGKLLLFMSFLHVLL